MTEKIIGMMDSAYFVSRQELIKWINQTLELQLQHIEDLGTGAIYTQLMDAAFGDKITIQMNKIDWKAKFQYQFVNNLKIFKKALQTIYPAKKVDIEKLAKAKSQDNLEMIQWLKRFIEINGDIKSDYNPINRRNFACFQSVTDIKKNINKNHYSASNYGIKNSNSQAKLDARILGSKQKNPEKQNNSKMEIESFDSKLVKSIENYKYMEQNLYTTIKAIVDGKSKTQNKLEAIKIALEVYEQQNAKKRNTQPLQSKGLKTVN